jgi:hypothetical protein
MAGDCVAAARFELPAFRLYVRKVPLAAPDLVSEGWTFESPWLQAPEVSEVASHLTPVPGGVGPMTVAMLMQNTLEARCKQANYTPLKG